MTTTDDPYTRLARLLRHCGTCPDCHYSLISCVAVLKAMTAWHAGVGDSTGAKFAGALALTLRGDSHAPDLGPVSVDCGSVFAGRVLKDLLLRFRDVPFALELLEAVTDLVCDAAERYGTAPDTLPADWDG
ncbi:hypothetical protein ACIG56_17295 [Nocardia fusca]|uniref:hypothetical protein n=1 Tax=Nocardia fusca TaxID=941183 RepID=UPI0037CC8A95